MTNLLLLLILFSSFITIILSQTKFTYSGTNQAYIVPNGVSTLYVQLWGAGGAGGHYDTASGASVHDFGGGLII